MRLICKYALKCASHVIPAFQVSQLQWISALLSSHLLGDSDIPVIDPKSGSTWSHSLKDKCHLTILASLCAISMYVVSPFEGQVPPHDFGLFVCHQFVRGLAL